MKKWFLLIFSGLLFAALLSGCGLFSQASRLSEIDIEVDGDPSEWEPFPAVHTDKKGDNITIDYDISIIKAFTDNQTDTIYILVESYILPKEFTSVEIDFQYGDDYYRVGLPTGDGYFGAIARQTGQDEWETVTDRFEYSMVTGEATELSFSISNFPNQDQLKIAKIRIMGGICCQQYEYYAIDYMN
ncbi:MAG: hypothetical protein AAGU05_05485 [Anaerolineaceae bacterium]